MKKSIFLFIVIMLAGITSVAAQPKKVQMIVSGLHCPVCASKLESGLKKIDGIENVSVNLKKGIVRFTIQEGKSVSDETLKETVKKEGYTVKSIKYLN